jgi:hypothetical protein
MAQFDKGSALCESPIEFYLLAALQDEAYEHPEFEFIIEVDATDALSHVGRREVICVPQARWMEQGYIFDFVLFDMRTSSKENTKALVVECDGHDYHERSKEQAAYDRFRDRLAVFTGFSVFRFTGSEIYRDAHECARQIIAYILKGIP